MITKADYKVLPELVDLAVASLPWIENRLILNQPTDRFFYDPWTIKPEFKNTIWQKLLDSIKEPIGEARLIKINTGVCYTSHADIDDRYHLSLTGEQCYLADVDNGILYRTNENGQWYNMDAGYRHSAVNFGNTARVQLVVRQLLPSPALIDPINITILSDCKNLNSRYEFDDVISPWLNQACKQNLVANVSANEYSMQLSIEKTQLSELLIIAASTTCIEILV